jgi:hypothetical protein
MQHLQAYKVCKYKIIFYAWTCSLIVQICQFYYYNLLASIMTGRFPCQFYSQFETAKFNYLLELT